MTEPTLLEQLTGVSLDNLSDAALLGAGFAAVIIAGQILIKTAGAVRRALTRRSGLRRARPDMIATVVGAVIVLALSVEGMWEFFGAIDMDGPARAVFCAVFEICLIAVALRSRHIRLLRQARKDALLADGQDGQAKTIRLRGINDALVWALAAFIGVLAALEAPTGPEQFFRFIVPFVATVMWELALGADVEDQRVTAAAAHWIDRAKAGLVAAGRACTALAVRLGWVPPTSDDATEQYREKRMTQLVDISHRIHTTTGDEKRKTKLLTRQRRLILDLQARGQWSRETLDELSGRLDVIFRAVELTAPAAVRTTTTPAEPSASGEDPAEPKPPRRTTPKIDPSAIARAYKALRPRRDAPRPSARALAQAAGVGRTTANEWMRNHAGRLDAELETV